MGRSHSHTRSKGSHNHKWAHQGVIQTWHTRDLHSDQGRNFESTVLAQTLNAFGLSKSRTTAYHLECDGMVEWFNRPLLQLLHSYVDTEGNWEKYLPLVSYGYRTSVHFSTGVSSFMMMYGRQPKQSDLSNPTAFDSQSYPEHVYGGTQRVVYRRTTKCHSMQSLFLWHCKDWKDVLHFAG